MASSEKFCLRWNDFEANVSSAFREIRDEKDFFDVTLACDDDSQIQAHKVIIAACSPFFRNVLRKNSHQHPLLYLKGVKYKELLCVLNFMYMGEVNVAQDDLNSFLAVAEDLRVKGLTQGSNNGGGGGGGERPKSEPKHVPIRPREPQGSSEPPVKRSRPSVPTPATSSSSYQSYQDDDIQEVVPVKSEPGTVSSQSAGHYEAAGQQENQVALEEQYDESYDYGQYGEGGYDDGSGMIDPNTGMPLQTADGNKDLEAQIEEFAQKLSDGFWCCVHCGHKSQRKSNIKLHIESQHLVNSGFKWQCGLCDFLAPNRKSFYNHMDRKHPKPKFYIKPF